MIVGLENLSQFRCGEGVVMAEDTLCSAWLAAPPRSAIAPSDMRLLQSEPRRASLRRGADAVSSFLPPVASSSTFMLPHSTLAPWTS